MVGERFELDLAGENICGGDFLGRHRGGAFGEEEVA